MRITALAAAGLLLASLALAPSGSSVTVVADILNVPPVIASISLVSGVSGGATPTAGGTASIGVTVVVSDANGASNIDTLQLMVLKPDGSVLQTFDIANPPDDAGSLTATYTARTVTIPFYEAPGAGYKVRAQAKDGNNALSNLLAVAATSSSFTVNTVVGIGAPTSIDLGGSGLTPGLPGDIEGMTITNTGNVVLDVGFSSDGLVGENATIPASALEVGLNSLLSDAADLGSDRELEADVPTGASSTSTVYMRLTPPEGLPAGSYSGDLTVTAVQS